MALGGCIANPPKIDDYRPTSPVARMAPVPTNGTIYQAGYETVFFEDIKARRIGDILEVLLTESINASKSASTSTSRTNESSITNPILLGSALKFDTPKLPHNAGRSSDLGASLSSSNEFDGSGDSSQSNSLKGSISVTVVDVLPNGNLVIKGEKWLTLNQGDEYIQLAGIVRVVDITANNTVNSNQIADARITYTGKGVINDANSMGWLSRFFISIVAPF